MPVEIVGDEAAAGDHLLAAPADQAKSAFDQPGSDTAAAQREGRLGMGDDHAVAGDAIAGEGRRAADVQFEALQRRIVADGAARGQGIALALETVS